MAQDLRDVFKEERERKYPMKPGHEARFMDRLDKDIGGKKKKSFTPLMVAATVLLLMGIGSFMYLSADKEEAIKSAVVGKPDEAYRISVLSLGDLSPDLQKIEQYYVTNINLELSELEISRDNKAMVDGFMERLAELNTEYTALNKELNTIGPNEQTINALITNLQLRLQLLRKLKSKLDKLKSIENEEETSSII